MSAIDISNKKFGRLTVLFRDGTVSKLAAWRCVCDCGTVRTFVGRSLRTGNTQSCGCLSRQRAAASRATGNKHHPSYEIWSGIWKRCTNPKTRTFRFYGGRGISVCPQWRDFAVFNRDMGPRPSLKHSLDRFPNKDGNYEPSNCRWATQKEQCRNTRRNRVVTMDGVSLCVSEWCERLGLRARTVHGRIHRGLSPIEALTRPLARLPKGKLPLIGKAA